MHNLSAPTSQPEPIPLHLEGAAPTPTAEEQSSLAQPTLWSGKPYPLDLVEERFWRQFRDEFLTAIHAWCVAHADRVAACYVPFSRDHLRVFVVRRSPTYDFSLGDALTDLESELFEKDWPCEVLPIPASANSTLEHYFKPAESIQVYGNRG